MMSASAKMPPRDLMKAHVALQTGCYFTGVVELAGGAEFAYSTTVEDHYWNYAFDIQVAVDNLASVLASLRSTAASFQRKPALVCLPDTLPSGLVHLISPAEVENELWMTCEPNQLKRPTESVGLEIVAADAGDAFEDFITVFNDGYGLVQEDAAVGYANLSNNYEQALRSASPAGNVIVRHYVAYYEGSPASIASTYSSGQVAGLYNVATAQRFRQKGLAAAISARAVNDAFSEAQLCFLQTEPDSPVEQLYDSLGFGRAFVLDIVQLAGESEQ